MDMLILGEFSFSQANNTPYEKLERKGAGGWVTIPRFATKPLSNQTGQPLDSIRIIGTWFYGAGLSSIHAVRKMKNSQEPQLLVDSYGNNLGFWTIKSLDEKQDRIIDDGTPMIINFVIELEEFANEISE